MRKRGVVGCLIVITAAGAGVLACGAGEQPERLAKTSEAILTCNPACTAVWTDCQQVTIKGTPVNTCSACGALGEAPCDASGPDQGCELQSGQTSVYMGPVNGLCAVCGDVNQPACDYTSNPFAKGCNTTSEIVPGSTQGLENSGGTCVPCGNANQPYCEYFLYTPECTTGTTPSSAGTCVGCGTPGAPQCATQDCLGGIDNTVNGDCRVTLSCQTGCEVETASGTGTCGGAPASGATVCEDEYGAFAPFAAAVVPDRKPPNQSSPTLVVITPSNYTTVDGTDTVANLQAFGSAMAQSSVWAAVSNEYSLGTLTAAPPVNGTSFVASNPSAGLTRADVGTYVTGLVSSHAVPAPNGNTTYLVYVPQTVSLDQTDWEGNSCGYNLGYPNDTKRDEMAIVRPCLPGDNDTVMGVMGQTASHEIVEAATVGYGFMLGANALSSPVKFYNGVPEPLTIWGTWNGGNVQLGDLCEGTRMQQTLGGQTWEFQRMFSNAAAQAGGDPCVPAAANPYFGVSTPQQWFAVTPGGSVEIPITGWSVAPIAADWFLNDEIIYSPVGGQLNFEGDICSPLGTGQGPGTGCHTHPLMNNATTATITVTAPASACQGDYLVFTVRSFEEDQGVNCNPALSNDAYHQWPVGVYLQGGTCACAGQQGWPSAAECQ
jgi:hypothetical protein